MFPVNSRTWRGWFWKEITRTCLWMEVYLLKEGWGQKKAIMQWEQIKFQQKRGKKNFFSVVFLLYVPVECLVTMNSSDCMDISMSILIRKIGCLFSAMFRYWSFSVSCQNWWELSRKSIKRPLTYSFCSSEI